MWRPDPDLLLELPALEEGKSAGLEHGVDAVELGSGVSVTTITKVGNSADRIATLRRLVKGAVCWFIRVRVVTGIAKE